jgi:polysaccharide biosynthesis protein PslH
LKILQICFRVPYPPHDGGAIAMYGITRNLALAGHEVTVLAVNTPKHFQKDDVLRDIAELRTVFIDTSISPLGALKALAGNIPYIVKRFISSDFEEALTSLLKNNHYDVIHFEGTYVAWYTDLVAKLTASPRILRSHNLEYQIWERLALTEKNPVKRWYYKKMASDLKKYETEYYKKFDAIAAITQEDAERIRNLGIDTRIEFIPAGYDPDRFSYNPERKPEPGTCFILSALNWIPNQEAMFWFLENVWPEVLKNVPDLQLHIAGKGTPEHIMNLKFPNVKIHGFVDDAVEFMYRYDLMLVPLLAGGGMRLKIIEGLALGKCIVSSPVGSEGINCTNGKNILICTNPDEWIQSLTDFFQNREKYYSLGAEAANLAEEYYQNNNVISKLVSVYRQLSQ